MTTETMLDALKIMIQKSSDARNEAAKTIMAIFAKSPLTQQRYNTAVGLALSDQGVDWSQSELELIMSYVDDQPQSRFNFKRIRRTIKMGIFEISGYGYPYPCEIKMEGHAYDLDLDTLDFS